MIGIRLVSALIVGAVALTTTDSSISALTETERSAGAMDSLDDMAIWVHPTDPEKSRIIATDTEFGLHVYDLDGREVARHRDGNFNNVDLRYGFMLGDERVDLLATGDRDLDRIAFYTIDGNGKLHPAGFIQNGMSNYGLCMYVSPRTGTYYVFVTHGSGKVEQWALDGSSGEIVGSLARTFALAGRTEGAVADDALGVLYLAQEQLGIWKYGAEPGDGDARKLVDMNKGGYVGTIVEGLTLFAGPGDHGYLIASSQSEDSFAVYERRGDNAHVLTFKIGAGEGIDEVTETDGIDVTPVALGSRFPYGLFVAHDDSDDGLGQNLKLVPWERIARAATPPLMLGGPGLASPPEARVPDRLASEVGFADGSEAAPELERVAMNAGSIDAEEPDAAGAPSGCGCANGVPAAVFALLAVLRFRRRRA